MGIGTLSIFAGIITTTIAKFLQISEINEGHRVATISWAKFHNTLSTLIASSMIIDFPCSKALSRRI